MTAERASDAFAVLAALRPEDPGIRSSITRRRDAVFLSPVSADDPTKWAVVHATEMTWFSLVVDGHYVRDVIDVDASLMRTGEHLGGLVAVAVAHLQGASRALRPGAGRLGRLAVSLDDEEHLLYAPLSRLLARLSPLRSRRARGRIGDAAEGLLSDHGLPHLSQSRLIVHPDMWDQLADIDLLQAGLAGSATWGRGSAGRRLRQELAGEALLIAVAVAERGLVDVAVGLADIAAQLDAY